MIENKCDNCKLQSVCKFKGRYEIDRKHLLAMPASLPPFHCEATAITVRCKFFAPTEAAQMAEIKANAERFKTALAPLVNVGGTMQSGNTDKDGGGK